MRERAAPTRISGIARAIVAPLVLALAGASCHPDVAAPVLPTPPAPPPDSDKAAFFNGGGCYPQGVPKDALDAQFSQIALINPHWAPVVGGQSADSDPILIHGTAYNPHGNTGGDFPVDHESSDATAEVELDEADERFVATGNGATESARLELEWESGKWPDWAWPGEGDRIVALGRWIFDCGHDGAQAGHCSASTSQKCIVDTDCQPMSCPSCGMTEQCQGQHFSYSSEMHPPYATAVMRSGRGGVVSPDTSAVTPATRADIFVSADGGSAGDRCVVTHADPLIDLIFSTECYPRTQPLAAINKMDFSFDVPLPAARPAGAAPSWRIDARPTPGGGSAAEVEVVAHATDAAPHLAVRVKLTQPVAGALPTGYAATLWAGWQSDAANLTHVRVTVEGLDVKRAVKPSMPVAREAPAWRMQASVNGEWQALAGLDVVRDATRVTQQLVFDQWLPSDGQLHLRADGHSQQCIDTMFGKSFRTDIKELQLSGLIACLKTTGLPSSPGAVDVVYKAPDFGAPGGMMTYATDGEGGDGGRCAASAIVCLSDGDCGKDGNGKPDTCKADGAAFTLRYRIEKLP